MKTSLLPITIILSLLLVIPYSPKISAQGLNEVNIRISILAHGLIRNYEVASIHISVTYYCDYYGFYVWLSKPTWCDGTINLHSLTLPLGSYIKYLDRVKIEWKVCKILSNGTIIGPIGYSCIFEYHDEKLPSIVKGKLLFFNISANLLGRRISNLYRGGMVYLGIFRYRNIILYTHGFRYNIEYLYIKIYVKPGMVFVIVSMKDSHGNTFKYYEYKSRGNIYIPIRTNKTILHPLIIYNELLPILLPISILIIYIEFRRVRK